jgi:hypothetical protein
MGQWMRRRIGTTAWIFVNENPGGLEPHFHMLIHVPPAYFNDLKVIASKWFGAAPGAVHIRKRKGLRDRCLPYLMKGTDFVTALRHGFMAKNQGPIEFKRCGWTESLGATARKRWAARHLNVPAPPSSQR